jgi:hypothetical protein
MPARTYRIALVNQVSTSIPLKLISAHTIEGGWTTGWSPPSLIDKNSGDPGAAPGTSPGTGQWQSESTAFPLHGTEAKVVYQIQDAKVNFNTGVTGITGRQNELTLHWTNPVFGHPNAPDVSFQSGGDIYVVNPVSFTAGGSDELPDLSLMPILPIPVSFFGEVDNPFVVMALQLVSPSITIVSFSVKRAFQGIDLSHGIRILRPGGGAISLRKLMDI